MLAGCLGIWGGVWGEFTYRDETGMKRGCLGASAFWSDEELYQYWVCDTTEGDNEGHKAIS